MTTLTITGVLLWTTGLTLLLAIVPFTAASLVGTPNAATPFKLDDLAKVFIAIVTGLIALRGGAKATRATGGKGARRGHGATSRAATSDSASEESAFRLSPSFDSGLYGGLIGGALAGLLITLLYYGKSLGGGAAGLDLLVLIFAYSCFAGGVFGACTQLGIPWARHAAALARCQAALTNGRMAWLPDYGMVHLHGTPGPAQQTAAYSQDGGMVMTARLVLLLSMLALASLLTASLAIAQAPTAQSTAPLELDLSVTQPANIDDPRIVLVSLRNRSETEPLTNIEMSIGLGDTTQPAETVGTLEPGQAGHASFNLPRAAANPYLVVSYDWRARLHSQARAIALPAPPSSNLLPGLLPAILGFAGGVFSSALAQGLQHVFTSQRERQRRDDELRAGFWSQSGPAYRNFVVSWGRSTDPATLGNEFTALRTAQYVPPHLVTKYQQTRTILDGAAPIDQKREACERLQEAFDRYIDSLAPKGLAAG